jgi:threonine synthase
LQFLLWSSFCFGPLEVDYEYEEIKKVISREKIESRGKTMWRYKELLPLDGEPTVGTQVGYTPLVKADNLAKKLGVEELYIKNDSVNFPTFSFKDRVVSAALSKAKELPQLATWETPLQRRQFKVTLKAISLCPPI